MSFTSDFVPGRESELLDFLTNFGTRATAYGAAIGLLPAQLTAYSAAVADFSTAYLITRSRSTRSGAAVIVKNEKKKAVVFKLRELAGIVQKHPGTTNEQRDLLGLTVPAVRQRRPAPAVIPVTEILSIVGNTLTIRAHGADAMRRAKPANCKQLVVFSHVGATPPAQPTDWLYQGASGRTLVQVAFDAALPVGTKVWVCAAWANDSGPGNASTPMQAVLMGTNASPTAMNASNASLSLAA